MNRILIMSLILSSSALPFFSLFLPYFLISTVLRLVLGIKVCYMRALTVIIKSHPPFEVLYQSQGL